MSQQFQAPPKNEMDHPRLALKGNKHANGKTLPSFKVALLANILRFRVYTGVEGEKSISVKLDPREVEAVMKRIRDEVIPNREDHVLKMEKTSFWIGGKKRDTLGVEATIVVGRHNGKVFISIYGYNTSKIAFPFTYGDAMKMYDADNNPLNPIDESNIAAYSWTKSIMGIAYPATVKNYKHPESNFNNNGGGNGGGGGGWNKGGNGGGNNGGGWNKGGNNSSGGSSDNSFDDDIAF